jgi:hypothetical protein
LSKQTVAQERPGSRHFPAAVDQSGARQSTSQAGNAGSIPVSVSDSANASMSRRHVGDAGGEESNPIAT